MLEGDEAHHLARVRRIAPGAEVELFDGVNTHSQPARVIAVSNRSVELRLEGDPVAGREAAVELTLATALPKGDRIDWLIEKAVEVGVRRLVPLRTERSVVDPREAKLDRLRRRIIEASKQCGRNRLMELSAPVDWASFQNMTDGCTRLFADPEGPPPAHWPTLPPHQRRVLAIGPEGGWSDREREAALADPVNGWTPVGLGTILLRIETAALVGSALVLSRE